MVQFTDEKTGINYTLQGDYFLPNLILPKQEYFHIGKYGRLRKAYLEKYRKALYVNFLATCKLNEHLNEVDTIATRMVEQIVQAMAEADGTDEPPLRATDQMRWAGLMNNYRHCEEEIVPLWDVVYK
jgi:predicted metalloendopeptidase